MTDASAGIGRAVAVRLARDGASLAICARRRDRLSHVMICNAGFGVAAARFVKKFGRKPQHV